jgi:hypothetical protein
VLKKIELNEEIISKDKEFIKMFERAGTINDKSKESKVSLIFNLIVV